MDPGRGERADCHGSLSHRWERAVKTRGQYHEPLHVLCEKFHNNGTFTLLPRSRPAADERLIGPAELAVARRIALEPSPIL